MKKLVLALVLVFLSSALVYAGNYALEFDGVDDYVSVPDSNSLDLTAGMTIEAWINSYNTAGAHVIVSKWDDFTGPDQGQSYIFKDHNDSDRLRIELADVGGDLGGGASIVTGNWTHVATTYDSNYLRLFYNGSLDGSEPAAGNIALTDVDLWIGAVNGGGGLESFSGQIDEVRIWNYARSEQELQDWMNYSLTGNEPGLVAYWNFDKGIGDMLPDLTSFGNNGTIYGAQWVASASPASTKVPEPTTMALLGLGSVAFAFLRRRES